MPINCLIKRLINFWTNREQFMNNSCSILVQSLFKQSIRAQKNESRFDETVYEHSCREKRKERAEKTTILSVFSPIRH